MNKLIQRLLKLLSTKFLVAAAGVVSGVALLTQGNTIEGAALVASSAIGYLAAEGYIDAKAVASVLTETVENIKNDDK